MAKKDSAKKEKDAKPTVSVEVTAEQKVIALCDKLREQKEIIAQAKKLYETYEEQVIKIADENPEWFIQKNAKGKDEEVYTKNFLSTIYSAGLYAIVKTIKSPTYDFVDTKTEEGKKGILNFVKTKFDCVKVALLPKEVSTFSKDELEVYGIEKTEYERKTTVKV